MTTGHVTTSHHTQSRPDYITPRRDFTGTLNTLAKSKLNVEVLAYQETPSLKKWLQTHRLHFLLFSVAITDDLVYLVPGAIFVLINMAANHVISNGRLTWTFSFF